MKITKVSYGKTYPLGNYSSERIDLESEVSISEFDPSFQDNCKLEVDKLKEMCDLIHQKNNPHLYQVPKHDMDDEFDRIFRENNIQPFQSLQPSTTEPLPTTTISNVNLNQPQPKLSLKEIYTKEINQCNTLDQLLSWEIMAKSNTELQEAYNLKLTELTK